MTKGRNTYEHLSIDSNYESNDPERMHAALVELCRDGVSFSGDIRYLDQGAAQETDGAYVYDVVHELTFEGSQDGYVHLATPPKFKTDESAHITQAKLKLGGTLYCSDRVENAFVDRDEDVNLYFDLRKFHLFKGSHQHLLLVEGRFRTWDLISDRKASDYYFYGMLQGN